jgi:hypothetical protein
MITRKTSDVTAATRETMHPQDLDPDGPDLSVSQVAEVLRLHPRTVLRYRAAGAFPHAKRYGPDKTGPWRIPTRDVIDYDKRAGE